MLAYLYGREIVKASGRGGWNGEVNLPSPYFLSQFLPPPYFFSQFLPPPGLKFNFFFLPAPSFFLLFLLPPNFVWAISPSSSLFCSFPLLERMLRLSKRLIICTQPTNTYISTSSTALTSKKANTREISI